MIPTSAPVDRQLTQIEKACGEPGNLGILPPSHKLNRSAASDKHQLLVRQGGGRNTAIHPGSQKLMNDGVSLGIVEIAHPDEMDGEEPMYALACLWEASRNPLQSLRTIRDELPTSLPDLIVILVDEFSGRKSFRVELDETSDAQRMEPQQPLPRTDPVNGPASLCPWTRRWLRGWPANTTACVTLHPDDRNRSGSSSNCRRDRSRSSATECKLCRGRCDDLSFSACELHVHFRCRHAASPALGTCSHTLSGAISSRRRPNDRWSIPSRWHRRCFLRSVGIRGKLDHEARSWVSGSCCP